MALPNGIDSRNQDTQSTARAAASRNAQASRNDPRSDGRAGDSVSERADFSAMLDSLRELDAAPEARDGLPALGADVEPARDRADAGTAGMDAQAAIYGSGTPAAAAPLPAASGGDSDRGNTADERRVGDARGAATRPAQGGDAKQAANGTDASQAGAKAGDAAPALAAATPFDLAPGADAPLPALSAEDLTLINLLASTPPAQVAPAAPAPSTASSRPAQMVEIAAPVNSAGFGGEFADSMRVMARGGVHSAELRLNPEQFGQVDVRIRITDGRADISLTGTPEARAALQDALPRLRESLAQAGIELGNTSIGTHQAGQQRGQQQGAGQGSGQGGWGYAGSQAGEDEVALPRPGRALGLVDTYA